MVTTHRTLIKETTKEDGEKPHTEERKDDEKGEVCGRRREEKGAKVVRQISL